MAKAQKKQQEKNEPPRNSAAVVKGYIDELVHIEDEMEPLKEHRKDILASAKDNGFDTVAIKNAVKFKRAEAEKQKRMREQVQNTETYLLFYQLSLFDIALTEKVH